MKKANNFQIAKVQPQGAFAWFFANLSIVLLIKKLLIKKACTGVTLLPIGLVAKRCTERRTEKKSQYNSYDGVLSSVKLLAVEHKNFPNFPGKFPRII